MADNLQKKGWLHQDHCVLCDGPLETCLHLSLLFPFTKAVWNQILTQENFDVQMSQFTQDLVHFSTWWEETTPKIKKKEKRLFNGLVCSSTHARIFERKEIKQFSITSENRQYRSLQELKSTLNKGRGHSKGGSSNLGFKFVYVLLWFLCLCLYAQLVRLRSVHKLSLFLP